MNYNLQLLWKDGRCPLISGILYADGTVKILNPKQVVEYNDVPEYSGTTTIQELSKLGEIYYTHIYKHKYIEITELELKVYYGEGSWGSEGFIAVCDSKQDSLQWIAFFEYSNPIINVEHVNGKIYAYSNLGHKWVFDIRHPENVRVELKASDIYFYIE